MPAVTPHELIASDRQAPVPMGRGPGTSARNKKGRKTVVKLVMGGKFAVNPGKLPKEGFPDVDGKAKKYKIPDPIQCGGESIEGETWVVSQNTEQVDISTSVGGDCSAMFGDNLY
ncbi:hypothetical protein B0H10DRAFT_1964878 [Mycena sp. CBHHK59/15]|nr:hypothetical protein B0H10DRAFT_1964878 [Mycena sp. CBHHK59/15]